MKRNHSYAQDKYISEIKFKYITSSTKKEQDYYAWIMSSIDFF